MANIFNVDYIFDLVGNGLFGIYSFRVLQKQLKYSYKFGKIDTAKLEKEHPEFIDKDNFYRLSDKITDPLIITSIFHAYINSLFPQLHEKNIKSRVKKIHDKENIHGSIGVKTSAQDVYILFTEGYKQATHEVWKNYNSPEFKKIRWGKPSL